MPEARAARETGARHILLVVLDTLRRDHLSTYGYERPTAPALDELAARAALFERAFSPAQWTLPAHASLFAGRYPSIHQLTQVDGRLGRQHATLAEILQTAGWRTAAFCNNPLLAALDSGLQRGFAHFFSYAGIARQRSDRRGSGSNGAWRRLMRPVQRRGARSDLLFRAALRPRLAPLWTRDDPLQGRRRCFHRRALRLVSSSAQYGAGRAPVHLSQPDGRAFALAGVARGPATRRARPWAAGAAPGQPLQRPRRALEPAAAAAADDGRAPGASRRLRRRNPATG